MVTKELTINIGKNKNKVIKELFISTKRPSKEVFIKVDDAEKETYITIYDSKEIKFVSN